MATAVALARLPDQFTSNQLINNIYNNAGKVESTITDLFKLDDSIFFSGIPNLEPVVKCDSDKFNRASYLWINNAMEVMQTVMDLLVNGFNEHGLVGAPDYTNQANIKLWLPMQLGLDDDYRDNINNNWQLIEDVLNNCYLYVEPYLLEGSE